MANINAMRMTDKMIDRLRAQYPKGTGIVLHNMEGEDRMPCGLKGTVEWVDDAGQIHVQWENGSSLALVFGMDSFSIDTKK